jgi:GT2 family glycosyltransferase
LTDERPKRRSGLGCGHGVPASTGPAPSIALEPVAHDHSQTDGHHGEHAGGTAHVLDRCADVSPTRRLRKTLAALEALDYDSSRYEIIVIDDGSEEVVRQIVQEHSRAPVSLTLEAQERLGAARARNRGARAASGELLLFCDDDILVAASHLQDHLATRHRHGDALVNGDWRFTGEVATRLRETPFGRYRIDLEQHFKDEAGGKAIAGDDACFEVSMVGSWNLSLCRDLFWEIGGFDEDFPVAGAEDQEFSLRARAAGCRLVLDTRIVC